MNRQKTDQSKSQFSAEWERKRSEILAVNWSKKNQDVSYFSQRHQKHCHELHKHRKQNKFKETQNQKIAAWLNKLAGFSKVIIL
jgi:hypothetical protein